MNWDWLFTLLWIPVWFIIAVIAFYVISILLAVITWDLRWALCFKAEHMPTETLKKKHDDWWPIISWVPRRFSAFLNGPNPKRKYPKQLFGTNTRIFTDQYGKKHKGVIQQDVPDCGTWCVSWPPHFVVLTENDKLFAFGIRKDYYEDYWTVRFCYHKNS